MEKGGFKKAHPNLGPRGKPPVLKKILKGKMLEN
jgi:hypothetical protein